MARNRIEVGWFVGEEHWETPVETKVPTKEIGPTERLRRDLTLLGRSFCLALVFVSLAASTSYSAFERSYRQVWLEIDSLLGREYTALINGDRDLYYELVADPRSVFNSSGWFDLQMVRSDARSQIELELIELEIMGDLARAGIRVTPPQDHWVPVAYVEQRYYRQRDGQWLRQSIPWEQWGEPRRLDTPYLSFEYLSRDEASIMAVAPDLQERYAVFREELGLAAPPWRTLFRVQPAFSRWSSSAGYRAFITSPTLLQLPTGNDAAEQVGDAASTVLASRVVGDLLQVYELYHMGTWYDVAIGIRNWYQERYFEREPYWLESGERALADTLPSLLPIRLDELTGSQRIESRHRYLRFALTTALAHHIVDEYGADRLVSLLRSMPQTESWQEIIPSIFGKSVRAFEAEWNLDLSRRFDVEFTLP